MRGFSLLGLALGPFLLGSCAGPTQIVPAQRAQQPRATVAPTEPSSGEEPQTRRPAPASKRLGAMTYLASGVLFRLNAAPGAKPVNLGQRLDRLATGEDLSLAVSRNGEHMVLVTTRFHNDCKGWACLAVLTGDAESPQHVEVAGTAIHPEGRPAISDDGALVVFSSGDGPHTRDLYALERENGSWLAPRLLTERSTHAYNTVPSLSPDGSAVLFDCGDVPYSQEGTGICEVSTDGVAFNQRIRPQNNPIGPSGEHCAHNADYMPDGSILFEADWDGQQLWVLGRDETTPRRVNAQFSNDNRPCSLQGGYVASLWYDRPGNTGTGELKIMQPDGPDFEVLTPSQDVSMLACHRTAAKEAPDAAPGPIEEAAPTPAAA